MTTFYDSFYKKFFSNQDAAKSLLTEFVTKEFVDDLDWDSDLTKGPTNFVTRNLEQRYNDLTLIAPLKSQPWVHIYVQMEFQSTVDAIMPFRIEEYRSLLLRTLYENKHQDKDILFVVYPLVIYTGNARWNVAQSVLGFTPNTPKKLQPLVPPLEYALIDVHHLPKADLEKRTGIAAELFKYERVENDHEFISQVKKLRSLLKDSKSLYDLITNRIKRDAKAQGIYLTDQEIKEKEDMGVAEAIARGRQESRMEGREEGREEGRVETGANSVITLLRTRFDNIPEDLIDQIKQISDLDRLSDLLVSAYRVSSLNEFKTLLH